MKYVILAWSKDWALIKDVEPLEYIKSAYSDAYFITYDNGKLRLFDTDQGALVYARRECEYFKIIDFHTYMAMVELV